jgi:hypothetical protein
MRNKTIALLVAGTLLSAPAFAKEHSQGEDERGTIKALERQSDALQRRKLAGNGGAVGRAQIAEQRREIRNLIKRLEAGQPVSPQEVDRVHGQ